MSKSRFIVCGSIALAIGYVFAPALSGQQTFLFRDAAHFYHPLFEYLRGEWSEAQLPLWNPYENAGQPLAADNTSSVFYPGKLIFALPLDFTLVYNLYILSHLVLAAVTSYRLARHWQASPLAAGLGALSYTLSGSVLFQYSNVPFLISAAWLPLACQLTDTLIRQGRLPSALQLAIVLALMITGGDPQMAYNVLLLAALYAVLHACSKRNGDPSRPAAGPVLVGHSRLLLIATTVTALLAAVQILPSWEASRASARGHWQSPRNIVELAIWFASPREDDPSASSWSGSLLGTAETTHERQIYQFSVPPWRAIELLWPNISGRQFPFYRRWPTALGIEGRVWTPSLYCGLLPLLLAIGQWSPRRGAPLEVRWLSWMALLAAAGSLGSYGPGWIVRQLAEWTDHASWVGDPTGGVYWLMNALLPGYVYFRYPAKLLVPTSLALAMLAARGFDQLECAAERHALRRKLVVVLALTALFACLVTIVAWIWADTLGDLPADLLYGPFDSSGARRDMLLSCGQAVIVGVLLSAVVARARSLPTATWGALALVITAIDLALADGWMAPCAPAADWQSVPAIATELRDAHLHGLARDEAEYEKEASEPRIYRPERPFPARWAATSSPNREREILAWDRQTLRPKYSLPLRIAQVDVPGTLVPLDYQMLWEVSRHASSHDMPDESLLDLLGVGFLVDLSAKGRGSDDEAPATPQLVVRESALPRAWIVHQAELLPPLAGRSISQLRQRTREVLFPHDVPRDWRRQATVETDDLAMLAQLAEPAEPVTEKCRVVSMDSQGVVVDVRLASPGLVILSDLYDPGWQLQVITAGESRPAPMLRADRVLRGACLPAGEHRLIYEYRPKSVLYGAILSTITVTGLIIGALAHRRAIRLATTNNSTTPRAR